jgi:hypothetical protein
LERDVDDDSANQSDDDQKRQQLECHLSPPNSRRVAPHPEAAAP